MKRRQTTPLIAGILCGLSLNAWADGRTVTSTEHMTMPPSGGGPLLEAAEPFGVEPAEQVYGGVYRPTGNAVCNPRVEVCEE